MYLLHLLRIRSRGEYGSRSTTVKFSSPGIDFKYLAINLYLRFDLQRIHLLNSSQYPVWRKTE